MPFAIRTALSFNDPAGGGTRFWYLKVKRSGYGGTAHREWVTTIDQATTWNRVGDAKNAFLCAIEHGVTKEAIMIVPVVLMEMDRIHHHGPFKVSTKNYRKVIVSVNYRDIARGRGITRKRQPRR